MVVPDFALICEIMLVSEGFQEARLLSRKFITLYSLCKELLSKQDHYDWGLRAIKSVLVVAGSLKVSFRPAIHYQVDLIRCTCQVYLIVNGKPYVIDLRAILYNNTTCLCGVVVKTIACSNPADT
jgi:hypothetical protein